MALQLANPYLSQLQGKAPAATTNQYGGSTAGVSKLVGTPNANIGTTKVNPAPAPQPSGLPSSGALSSAAAAAQASAEQQAAAAAAQAAAARASLIQQVTAGQQSIQQGGQTSLTDLTNSYGQNNRNTVQSIQSGQQGINTSRENTALNLRRSMATILDTIRQGFHSGTAQLAGMHATDSGATADLARAYAHQGGVQANDAHNTSFLANQGIDTQQQQLDQQKQNALADFTTYRNTEVDRISNSVFDQLRTLDANAAASGVTGQVNYGVRDQLINQAIAQLNAIDQQTAQALAGVTPESQGQINTAAARMDAGGSVGYQAPAPRSVI